MKMIPKTIPFAVARATQRHSHSLLRLTLLHTNSSRLSWPSEAGRVLPRSESAAALSTARESICIYAVDDVPALTELYKTVLEPAGYIVNTFNFRGHALAALSQSETRPALLITDYLGSHMPVQQFVQACRRLHPRLRVLMASGLSPSQMHFPRTRPDQFLQKPFTPDQLQQAVTSALVGA